MSLQAAVSFLQEARRDENLRRELDALEDVSSLDALVSLAERAGFRFTPDELERAHAHDWRMRWARYQR